MKKIYSLLIVLLFVGGAFAQKTAVIKYTKVAPEMDGFMEETWDASSPAEKIDVNFKAEVATIGNTTWQALYDDNNFYVVVNCEDDNHWPGWESGGNNWEYDKPEIYWDVNTDLLKDGAGVNANGASGGSSLGHWQLAPGFTDGSYGTAVPVAGGATINPGGTVGYDLVGEGYIFEHTTPFASLKDKDGNAYDPKSGKTIGFDITVIDQDEGVTTVRQRSNWNNAGAIDEAWNNMDDAGTVTFETVSSSTLKTNTMWVSASADRLTLGAACNKVVISNILGQQVKSATVSSKNVNISDLSKGVYVVKAFNNSQLVGTAKFTKN